jgi:hypothetical protein
MPHHLRCREPHPFRCRESRPHFSLALPVTVRAHRTLAPQHPLCHSPCRNYPLTALSPHLLVPPFLVCLQVSLAFDDSASARAISPAQSTVSTCQGTFGPAAWKRRGSTCSGRCAVGLMAAAPRRVPAAPRRVPARDPGAALRTTRSSSLSIRAGSKPP